MKKLLFIIVCFVSLSQIMGLVHAETIYKIADSSVISPPDVKGIGRVIWGKSFVYERHGLPVILSANPDGIGNINVGDQIQIFVSPLGSLTTRTFDFKSTSDCRTRTSLQPADLSNLFPVEGGYNISIRILDWCGLTQNISSMYLVSGPLLPKGPEPFLDLPWDYAGQGLTFDDAALSMTAFFDHSFPYLSAGLKEPQEDLDQVTTFENDNTNQKPYSAHDGYDFGRLAGAVIGQDVLAAASGIATFVGNCKACGNMILIDHGNHYQTRYMHLQDKNLIINLPDVKVPVSNGQVIGKVGATGNVNPPGELGAHLHFMVVEDINHDGNFEDDIPDGVTDPFGWLSTQPDPWLEKSGSSSFYLFKKSLSAVKKNLTSQGEVFIANNFAFTFPSNSTSQTIYMDLHISPMVRISNQLTSIGPTVIAIAKDIMGNTITKLNKNYQVKINFSHFNTSIFKNDSISIYSSEDGINWFKEETDVNWATKEATAQVDHLSRFALLGEVQDSVAPSTKVELEGERGDERWFRSDVRVKIESEDNPGGVGVDYILFKINDDNWKIYDNPIIYTQPGHYKVEYYSSDRNDNMDEVKTVEFDIDKQIPEIKIQYSPQIKDYLFKSEDANSAALDQSSVINNMKTLTATDRAGNKLTMVTHISKEGNGMHLSIRSLTYNLQFPSALAENTFNILDKLTDKNQQRKLDQSFELMDSANVKLIYHLSDDETSIQVNDSYTEMMPGMKLLQISTKNGTLIYTY